MRDQHATANDRPVDRDAAAGTVNDPDDGITVVEHPASAGGGVFPNLLDVYSERGFDRGYRRAVSDVLATVLFETESYARQRGIADPSLHATLSAFGDHLERQIQRMRSNQGGFCDGAGI
jgi:hypothetical protein